MQLNYKVFGEGEPLIILHGLLGSLDNWQTLAKQYAEHFTVFIIDLRNHGKSPHSDEFSYNLMVEDLLNFCNENFIYRCHLLGHSMGGKVAMQFALSHGDYIEKLIVADIAPVTYDPGHNAIFEALRSIDLKTVQQRKEVEDILAQSIPQFGVRQFLMKGLTRDEHNAFIWKFNLDSLWKNYTKILGTFQTEDNFDGETLFIYGDQSDYIQEAYFPIIDKYFVNNEKVVIQGAGHWLHAENPKEFLGKTLSFLLA